MAALPVAEYGVGNWDGFLASMVNVNDSFVDVTGVTMRMLTSTNAPYPSGELRSYSMNYGAGGSKISQAFGVDGDEYWIIYLAFDALDDSDARLAKYKRGVGVVSDVPLSISGLNVNRLSYTFSYRPGEADILYYTTDDGQVRRANVASQQATRAGFTGHASLFNEANASTPSLVGEIPGWLQMPWNGGSLLFGADWISQDKFFHIDLETGVITSKTIGQTGTMYPLKGGQLVAAIAYDNGTKGFWHIANNRMTAAASIPGSQGHSDVGESVFYTHSSDGTHLDWSRATPGTAPAIDGGAWSGSNTVFVQGSAPSNVVMDGDYHPSMGWDQRGKGADEYFLVDSDYADPYRHSFGSWSVHSGSIYRASVTWDKYGSNAIGPGGVLLWNGVNTVDVGAFTGHLPKAASLAAMTAGSWWWESNQLYVWMADGASPLNRVRVISGSKLFSSVGFMRNGDGAVRKLCHTYRNDASYKYNRMTYVNQSQDGKIAAFASNRGVQGGRAYLIVAEVPVS